MASPSEQLSGLQYICEGANLLKAASAGNCEEVVRKLDAGIDIEYINTYVVANDSNEDGPALTCAAYKGHVDVVGLLLNRGADIEGKDSDGWTALMCAASGGHANIINLLLDREANIENTAGDGRTALMAAVSDGKADAINLLLDRGAVIDRKDEGCCWTSLMGAASGKKVELVGLFLDRGADPENEVDISGYSEEVQKVFRKAREERLAAQKGKIKAALC